MKITGAQELLGPLVVVKQSRDYLSRGVCVLCVFSVCSVCVLCVFCMCSVCVLYVFCVCSVRVLPADRQPAPLGPFWKGAVTVSGTQLHSSGQ